MSLDLRKDDKFYSQVVKCRHFQGFEADLSLDW